MTGCVHECWAIWAALKRLYVADYYDEIVDALVGVAKTMQMGKPWGDGVVLGRYYEERFEAVDGLVKAALSVVQRSRWVVVRLSCEWFLSDYDSCRG